MNPWLELFKTRHPLWEQDPEQGLSGLGPLDEGPDLSAPLQKRYGTKDPEAIGGAFGKEVGVDPYQIHVTRDGVGGDDAAEQSPGVTTLGRWTPSQGRIDLNPALDPAQKAETLAHEIGHAADTLRSGYDSQPVETDASAHHKYFPRFVGGMAQSMEAQRALEAGLPVHPQLLAQYPWLKNVNPQSSNKLANPWDYYRKSQESEDPELWNALHKKP